MKIERDERRLDFHDIGREIKQKRERKGMTQEQLAYIIDRDPRTVMYHENDGQHPSLNVFYQLVSKRIFVRVLLPQVGHCTHLLFSNTSPPLGLT